MCVVPGRSNASIALRTPQDWSHRHGLQPVASRCRTRHRPEAEEIWHQTCSERWNIHKHHAESCISALNLVNPAHGNLMKLMVLEWKHAPEGKESVIFSQWKWNLYGSCMEAVMLRHAVACCGMLLATCSNFSRSSGDQSAGWFTCNLNRLELETNRSSITWNHISYHIYIHIY